MESPLVSIRDITADIYLPPNCVMTLGHAIREFGDNCQNAEHPLGKHPADYELFHVGWWNATTGNITDLDGNPGTKARKQLTTGNAWSQQRK